MNKKGLDYLVLAKPPEPELMPNIDDKNRVRALQLFDTIYALASQMPEVSTALSFADNAVEFVASVKGHLQERGRVTQRQITALENIRDGLRRWLD